MKRDANREKNLQEPDRKVFLLSIHTQSVIIYKHVKHFDSWRLLSHPNVVPSPAEQKTF